MGKEYKPQSFDLNRPPHLLASDLLSRIEHRNDFRFADESYVDVEQLIWQLVDANTEGEGWLIEKRTDGQILWAQFGELGVEWVADSLKACRFARRSDAEQMAYGEEVTAITHHLWR